MIIAFVFVSLNPYLSAIEQREGVRPREGITIVHSTNINARLEYYFVSTRDPNLIGVRISVDPVVNTIKPTIVGMYFPYDVNLDRTYNSEHVNYTNWYESKNEYGHGTAFVWNVPCQTSDNCNLHQNQEVQFILNSNSKFDSRDAYRHSIKIKFDNTYGISSEFFNRFEKSENLAVGVERAKVQATVVIPENAQQIHTIPMPQPNMFHNMGVDYSNTQLDWNVTKDSRIFFVDYDMANERIDFEEKQNQFTTLSLFVGLVTGGLGIAVAIFYGKNNKADPSFMNNSASQSLLKKDGDTIVVAKRTKTDLIERKYLAIICVVIPFIVFISAYLNLSIHEISNNVTLVVEVGVGFIMAIVIYAISRRSETEIENKVNDVFGIVKEREHFRKNQEKSIHTLLLNIFTNMETNVEIILYNAELYENENDQTQKEYYKQKVIAECKQLSKRAEEYLDNPSIISPEFFDVNTIGKFKTLSILCKTEPRFIPLENKVHIDFCDIVEKMVKEWIEDFAQKVKGEIETTNHIELQSNTELLSISTNCDRTVYPLDSVVHVQANVPVTIKGEKIIFEVFNADRKLLLSKEVDPEKFENLAMMSKNIFEVSFEMKGHEWNVNKEYVVRATHSSSYSEDSFLVDQRMPALQSDKSVYTINSDMIITVIDPDADKDSNVADHVGNREDSRLIIESPYGKIDGYKLRETGNSTGIFQGIIGILGIRKDGSVIERNLDGKIINKIQGEGLEDGFVGTVPGKEITISYKNNTGTVYLTIFVASFGVAIEFDNKIYNSGDKVCVTIVAPDFNFNSDLVDEIGQKPESIVNIRTSKDELSNYKLVETGTDTGIFTGEFYLVDSLEKSSRSKTTVGTNDGRIACNEDDFIQVILNFFGMEEVVGSALIKPKS